MRSVGRLSEAWQAQRLCDVLLLREISSEMSDEEDGTFRVWVHQDSQLDQARALFAEFERDPDAPTFVEAERQALLMRKEAVKEEKRERARRQRMDRQLRPPPRFLEFGVVVPGLIGISVVVAVMSGVIWGSEVEEVAGLLFTVDPRDPLPKELLAGQLWRLITPIFIHFDLLHLAFNMLWLWSLGRPIETLKGSGYLAVLVVALAVFSNSGQHIVDVLLGKPGYFGGMSGVVYGLFGYVWAKSRFEPFTGFGMHPNTAFLMMAWFVLCFTGMLGPVANTAHAAGLILGGGWGFLTARLRRW